MAFLKKPLKWTALGQEPSELKKSEGFKMDESPAPGHFDFMFRSTYEAIEELQQKAGEVKTVNNVQPDINGNVLITLPDTSKLYQKPTTGIPTADLDTSVQASLKKADDAAPTTELAKTNQALTTYKAEYAQHIADLISHGVYGTATGANTLAMTISNVSGYVEGMLVAFKNTTANTGAVTLNINSLGAKAIKKANGNALSSGSLKTGGIYQLRYDGSSFILLGEGGEYGTATANDVLSGKTFGTENGLVNGTLTLASLGGKKWASGSITVSSSTFSITGLNFTPSKVLYYKTDISANPSAVISIASSNGDIYTADGLFKNVLFYFNNASNVNYTTSNPVFSNGSVTGLSAYGTGKTYIWFAYE